MHVRVHTYAHVHACLGACSVDLLLMTVTSHGGMTTRFPLLSPCCCQCASTSSLAHAPNKHIHVATDHPPSAAAPMLAINALSPALPAADKPSQQVQHCPYTGRMLSTAQAADWGGTYRVLTLARAM